MYLTIYLCKIRYFYLTSKHVHVFLFRRLIKYCANEIYTYFQRLFKDVPEWGFNLLCHEVIQMKHLL